jgi:tetratricopeptide (TPR) repeat protein
MRHSHLSRREIRKLIEVESNETQTKLLLHHLAVCPECYASGGYILDLHAAGLLPERFSSVDVDLARSRADAPALYQRLARFPFVRQKGLIRDTRRFKSFGLAELLCAESRAAAARDPGRALELAELATLVATVIREWEPVEEAWLCLLRSLAWAHLGNARRVVGEIRSAEDAFVTAEEWWKKSESMGDILEYEGTILALKASLRRTQGRFIESLTLLDAALAALGTSGTRRSEILASRAFTLGEMGESAAAIEAFREAVASTDRDSPPRLAYVLRHNLLDALSKAGRFEEARLLLPEVRVIAAATGEPVDLIRFRWIEGRIFAKTGKQALAVGVFREVRSSLTDLGLLFDAALAGLEEAHLRLEAGEAEEVRAIAAELLPVFEGEGIPREAHAALLLFCRAAEARIATAELVALSIEALERARKGCA